MQKSKKLPFTLSPPPPLFGRGSFVWTCRATLQPPLMHTCKCSRRLAYFCAHPLTAHNSQLLQKTQKSHSHSTSVRHAHAWEPLAKRSGHPTTPLCNSSPCQTTSRTLTTTSTPAPRPRRPTKTGTGVHAVSPPCAPRAGHAHTLHFKWFRFAHNLNLHVAPTSLPFQLCSLQVLRRAQSLY